MYRDRAVFLRTRRAALTLQSTWRTRQCKRQYDTLKVQVRATPLGSG